MAIGQPLGGWGGEPAKTACVIQAAKPPKYAEKPSDLPILC